MKRYTFLLLAFFLVFLTASRVFALTSVSNSGPSVTPSTLPTSGVKQTSARNVGELGNISESTTKAQQPPTNVPDLNKGTKTTSANGVSCKTYEGKVYAEGEAGYNDCIKTIKSDRQGTKNVP